MSIRFGIMIPYRIATKTNDEYSNDIRALVKHVRDLGIKVCYLNESDILDKNKNPIEHVYVLDCFGVPECITDIFSNVTVGCAGEPVFYA